MLIQYCQILAVFVFIWLPVAVISQATLQDEEALVHVVRAIRGKTARLPCNLTSPGRDSAVIALWTKNGTKTPVYNVDWRKTRLSEGQHTDSESLFQDRAHFQVAGGNSALIIQKTRFNDSGSYRCRVDFKARPTHIEWIHLHIIDPPRSLKIYSLGGIEAASTINVQEGHPVSLSCKATGGYPTANVTWWSGEKLLDGEVDDPSPSFFTEPTKTILGIPTRPSATAVIVQNNLKNISITPDHLKQGNLTCQASNNPDVAPLSQAVSIVPIKGNPLIASLTSPKLPLIGMKEYEIACEAKGVQPPPVISWHLQDKILTENIQMNLGKSTTKSILLLKAGSADDGSELECRAVAPSMPHLTAQDKVKLHVNYVPEALIRLVTRPRDAGDLSQEQSDEEAGFSEGDSAAFSCSAKANPPSYRTMFLFNGRPIHQEKRAQRNGNTIVIPSVTHSDAGLYTCVASNSIGDGQSNAVRLHINYSPVCKSNTENEVLGLKGEKLLLNCEMLSSPKEIKFEWWVLPAMMEKDQPPERESLEHEDEDLTSQAVFYLDNTTNSYVAKCLASNIVGKTHNPCVYNIRVVELPEALIGCKHEAIGPYSANVSCLPGKSGGLVQQFHLEVRDMKTNKHIFETVSLYPKFHVTTLEPERSYTFLFYASHSKGKGLLQSLIIQTKSPLAEKVAHEEIAVTNDGERSTVIEQSIPPPTTGSKYTSASLIVSISAAIVVTTAVLAASLVRYRWCHRNVSASSQRPNVESSNIGISSKESLLEIGEASILDKSASSSKEESFTSFAPVASILRSTPLDSRHSSPVPVLCPVVSVTSSRSTPDVSPKSKRTFHSLRAKDYRKQSVSIGSSSTMNRKSVQDRAELSNCNGENIYVNELQSEFVCSKPEMKFMTHKSPERDRVPTGLTVSNVPSSLIELQTGSKNIVQGELPLSQLESLTQENTHQGMRAHTTFKSSVTNSLTSYNTAVAPSFYTSETTSSIPWPGTIPSSEQPIQQQVEATVESVPINRAGEQAEGFLVSFGRLKSQNNSRETTPTQDRWSNQRYLTQMR